MAAPPSAPPPPYHDGGVEAIPPFRLPPLAWSLELKRRSQEGLEVVPPDEKQVVPGADPQAVGGGDGAEGSGYGGEQRPLTPDKEVVGGVDDKEVRTPSSVEDSSENLSAGRSRRRRWLTLFPRRRTALLLSGLLLVVALALALGLGLGLTSRHKTQRTTPDKTASPPPRLPIHADSKLAATNWTDAAGIAHHAIFYQDPSKAIMMRLWDSQNETWSTSNVSASAAQTSGQPAIASDVRPGTSIAATALLPPGNLELSVYYQSSQGGIYELYTHEPSGDGWQIGGPGFSVPAAEGTSIAAYHENICSGSKCDENNTTLYVLYEPPAGGSFRVLNRTGYSWHHGPSPTKGMMNGTGMAIVPWLRTPVPANISGPLTPVLNVFAQKQDGSLVQMQGRTETGLNATTDDILTNANMPSAPHQIAATSFGQFGWVNTLVGILQPNGTLSAYAQGEKFESKIQPMDGLRYRAIAFSMGMRLYGLTEGGEGNEGARIEEWSFTRLNPFVWSKVGDVI